MLISIIVPVYNEQGTIETIIQRIHSVDLDYLRLEKEIIVIDDCSKDNTYKIATTLLNQNKIRLIRHPKNLGKGAALRTGFLAAQGEIIIIQDADMEYDPKEYPKLLNPILQGKADVVYGSRFMGGEPHRVLYFWHYVGNRFLTLLSNMTTNLNLTDMETCYKIFNKTIIKKINLKENRFGIEPEFTAKIARIKCRIYEVGISYTGRTYEEGKKINWKDGIRAIFCIIKYGLLKNS